MLSQGWAGDSQVCLCVPGVSVCPQNEVTLLRNEVAQLKQLLLAHKDCPVTALQKKTQGYLGEFWAPGAVSCPLLSPPQGCHTQGQSRASSAWAGRDPRIPSGCPGQCPGQGFVSLPVWGCWMCIQPSLPPAKPLTTPLKSKICCCRAEAGSGGPDSLNDIMELHCSFSAIPIQLARLGS